MTCTFFGHRNCSMKMEVEIKRAIERLITDCGVTLFYVGNNGRFDEYVYSSLKELKKKYSYISFYVVLAYIPCVKRGDGLIDYSCTIVPDGIEGVPKKFAIPYRNKWMIEKADYVIGYIVRNTGGAAKFFEEANKKGKICVNLAK